MTSRDADTIDRPFDPPLDPPFDNGLFGPDSVTWRVHADPTMLLGGFRALMLQALHPLVMAGFDANTMFWADPWGRLQRTAQWVGVITYGTSERAIEAGAHLQRLHASLPDGVEPESGATFRVDDPELLLWVHCTQVESFLSTYRRSGGELDPGDGDRYVDEMRRAAELVGLDPADVPGSEAELAAYYEHIRPQLRVTRAARRNVLRGFTPPMPRRLKWLTPARPAWAGLVTISAGMLPGWARRLYGLPGVPTTDVAASLSGRALRSGVLSLPARWRQGPLYREAVARAGRLAASTSG